MDIACGAGMARSPSPTTRTFDGVSRGYLYSNRQSSPGARSVIRKLVNKLGFDVVRFPHRAGYEWHVLQLFEHLRIDTVIDVGANRGQHALSLRNLGYTGWIYSFEPVNSIFKSLLWGRLSRRTPCWRQLH